MPKKKSVGIEASDDALIVSVADALNKMNDGVTGAFFLGDDEAPTDLNMWVSTGSSDLDVRISNRIDGGLAFGRIYEVTGLEQSGKSLLCAHIMANVQKAGGIAVLIDTESAVNEEFLEAIGVNLNKPNGLYVPLETVEDIFEYIEKIIETIRKGGKEKKVVIVVDSVAAATTRDELAADYSAKGYNTKKPILISMAMRKITNLIAREKVMLIFTNQLRAKMNAGPFEDPWTTSGGKAIAFHASVRLRAVKGASIKKGDNVIGTNVKVKVIKNRLGPPLRTASFDIYFDRGIDDEASMFRNLKDANVFDVSGSWCKYTDSAGVEHRFQSTTFVKLIRELPTLRRELYERMCNAIITQYHSGEASTLDGSVELETDEVSED